MRFDFHPTPAGWRISEVNSDVPGGLNEASRFTALMAAEYPDVKTSGDPLAALASAIKDSDPSGRDVGLLSVPGCTEDFQVTEGVAAALAASGIRSHHMRPEELSWRRGHAHLNRNGGEVPLGAIYRFYQGEWLDRVPPTLWRPLFRGGVTPVCNPAASVLSESKRLPLLWPELGLDLPSWRRWSPPVTRVRALLGTTRDNWILKRAYSNTGEAVLGRDWQPRPDWWLGIMRAQLQPNAWLAQRRFNSPVLDTPLGPMRLCLGVYIVNGKSCGIYGRLTPGTHIDAYARDVAVLIRTDSHD
jgi:hypothetical protein